MTMDHGKYLKRINFTGNVFIDHQTLVNIHEHHVFQVPFENLDCYYNRVCDLEIAHVYEKVVGNRRGGFCYELNLLFAWLLNAIGFSAVIISARILDSGKLGPEYDHMCIHIKTDKDYLADVGYGDLFLRPLEIRPGIQTDGRNYFQIEEHNDDDYLLSMSSDRVHFETKYTFNLKETPASSFHNICFDKQTNPDSYFVKNRICTKPTTTGRLTLFNNKFTEKINGDKIETMIMDDKFLRDRLKDRFGILLP
jgi:N-hydroxyarylamine O-acetyltransferase